MSDMVYVKKKYCICEQYGLDGTKGHTEIVATVENPSWPAVHFLSCANHVHLYRRNGFTVHKFDERPRQSKFFLLSPMEESL